MVLYDALRADAEKYFQRANSEVSDREGDGWRHQENPDFYWSQVSGETSAQSQTLIERLLRLSAQIAEAAGRNVLLSTEDVSDLRESTKVMKAALRLRRYRFHSLQVLNDEDRVLGVQPAWQSDNEALAPQIAYATYVDYGARVWQMLSVLQVSPLSPPGIIQPALSLTATKYRPGTAFIMMWMDSTKPELIDTVDSIKTVFRNFNIAAVRADDIEHNGRITKRVLNELRTSEFLFADLTGTRPNVYYEVGFAHALNRRVILYRQSGTGLHFDLADYNCPEYKNLVDLREKLTKRLETMINQSAEDEA